MSKKKKERSAVLPGIGINCPRCGRPTEIRGHIAVSAKQLAQPYYYSRWFNCAHADCATTLIMRDEYRVFNDPEKGAEALRLDLIKDQLRRPDAPKPSLSSGNRPPWE